MLMLIAVNAVAAINIACSPLRHALMVKGCRGPLRGVKRLFGVSAVARPVEGLHEATVEIGEVVLGSATVFTGDKGGRPPVRGVLAAESLAIKFKADIEELKADKKELKADKKELKADNTKFKADIEELNARVDNLQPAGDLVLLNVCAQVLDGLLFAAYSRIPPVAKPKKTKVYYKSTCTLFVQLYKRLSSKGIEDSTLKALAGSSPVKDFCKGADALMDARNLSVHPPSLKELDRLVKDALKLVTPEVKARSPTLSRACDVLEQYEAVIRPAINSALISSRKRS
ncbi:hypothetical protein HYH02_005219 [Chlamydomonas schloesseri]|uniref:Uncharacterized protein n=1 Tax=Chlamydomonas schloesseri TaxID=2026947 RepID=A0A836B763_9CHLO|nr:hypothetical protein HYH02_005219 [Chlamydomonas schloesseri]|eukprot:KAG2449691.1 hypothetical protein HYH02_005219 [Chlamydomonas schloesseri]